MHSESNGEYYSIATNSIMISPVVLWIVAAVPGPFAEPLYLQLQYYRQVELLLDYELVGPSSWLVRYC